MSSALQVCVVVTAIVGSALFCVGPFTRGGYAIVGLGVSLVLLAAYAHIVAGVIRGVSNWMRARARPRASFDDQTITIAYPETGVVHRMSWSQLAAVSIMTTDAGPFLEDVFLVLGDGATELLVPQAASGFSELLERVESLPYFKKELVVEAMTSTSNRRFECWTKGT